MKLSAIAIAIGLAGIVGIASASGANRIMRPVTVSSSNVSLCTPPNGSMGHACDSYDQFLHANFSQREIGMLFGYRTAYPAYLTGGFERLQQRYDKLLQQYLAAHAATNPEASVASR